MKTQKHLFAIISVFFIVCTPALGQLSNVTYGYVGNQFNGANEKWVQQFVDEIELSSDGTVYTASDWDEGGRCAGYYKDGDVLNPIMKEYNGVGGHNCWGWGTAGAAVALDATYIYLVNCDGDLMRFKTSDRLYVDKTSIGECVGATCSGGKIYLVLATGAIQRRSTSALGTIELTVNVSGAKDIAVDASGNMWILTPTEVLKYNSSGTNTGIKVTGAANWEPNSVSITNAGKLMLTDNGPDMQVKIYNISQTPTLESTFGDLGGISSGTPGQIAPKKFWKMRGAATDANGNIYVAMSDNAVGIRKFTSSGTLVWEVLNMFFTDVVNVDPNSDGNVLYGINEKMTYDFNNHNWNATSFTLDRTNQPNDPRAGVGQGSEVSNALIRRVNGNLVMFQTGMYAGNFNVYRFDGEIAKFCTNIPNTGWSGLPDKNGNIWYESNGIKKISLTGFSNGCPDFGSAQSVSSVPSPFTVVERVNYDVDSDVMYISGWTNANPNTQNDWGVIGTTISRYPNWSTGNRTASHTLICPLDAQGYTPKAFTVCGDYVFMGGSRDVGKVYVYNAATLSLVGYINPPSWATYAWLDIPHAIQVFKRSNGLYMIFVEDNVRSKNLVYEWCPTGNCSSTISVTGVSLAPATASLNIGSTQQLAATISPSNATNQVVSWSTSNASIATVSSSGLVTGVAAGTATITVTTQDGNKTATCIVTVNSAGGSALITGTQSDNITPYCCGNDGSNAFDGNTTTYVDDVATTGGYTQLDFGSSKNITKIKYYPRATFALRMNGGIFQGSNDGTNFTTVYTISSTPTYAWNETNVNVNYRYMRYLGPTNGYCNVAEIEFWGTDGTISVTGVTVSPTSASITVGATQQLTSTITPSNATNQIVSWSTNNASIATVSASGLVTGIAAGTATITVTTQDGNKTAACVVSCTCTDSKLIGLQFDNITPYGGADADGNKAFDNNTTTYVDAEAVSGSYTGIDFGSSTTISTIKYYPRSNNALRMVGGKFQGSNDGVNYTDVFTISNTPSYAWTSVAVNVSYRYMRYLGPSNGYCNLAEIEFWGGCSISNPSQVRNVATSVNLVPKSNNINLFPNPAKVGDIIRIDGHEKSIVNIYDIEGRMVYSTQLIDNSLTLPTSIKRGLYIVSINDENQTLVGKLTVK